MLRTTEMSGDLLISRQSEAETAAGIGKTEGKAQASTLEMKLISMIKYRPGQQESMGKTQGYGVRPGKKPPHLVHRPIKRGQ